MYTSLSYFDNYKFINDGYSPYDFKQKVLINVTTPKVGGFTFGAFLNMIQAGRFSAIISPAEVMGTNIRKLRGYSAYVFSPDDPKTLEFQGAKFVEDMKYVLANAGPSTKEYLEKNMSQYAQPNGGLMGGKLHSIRV